MLLFKEILCFLYFLSWLFFLSYRNYSPRVKMLLHSDILSCVNVYLTCQQLPDWNKNVLVQLAQRVEHIQMATT
jgi:hypothetical protein